MNNSLRSVSPVFQNIQDIEDITQCLLPSDIRNNSSYILSKPPLNAIIFPRTKENTSLMQKNGIYNLKKKTNHQ